jgi:hypothetical protein
MLNCKKVITNKYTQWIVLLILVNLADILTTHLIMIRGGKELNPFMVNFVGSPFTMMIPKSISIIIIMILAISGEKVFKILQAKCNDVPNVYTDKLIKNIGWIVITAPLTVTSIVVVSNVLMIFKSFGYI